MGEFFRFYREYAQTGVHAASAAALTAFGLLMQFHEGFAVLAFLAYVVPLTYRYRQAGDDLPERPESEPERDERTSNTEPATAASDDHEAEADHGAPTGSESERDAEPTSGDESERDVEAESGGRPPATWDHADASVDANLLDVVDVSGSGETTAYAVGEEGVVIERAHGEWETVLEDGPGAAGNTLRGVDATGDGRAVWFTGDGGALGRLDVETGRHTDHSAPNDNTSTWSDVAVAGSDGRETLLLVNGSGQLLRGQYDGEETRWRSPVKPGSGSSLSAVEVVDTVDANGSDGGQRRAYAADTNGGVFQSTGTDDEWEGVGIDDAGALTDLGIGVDASEELVVTGDDGTLYRYDGSVWTPAATVDDSLRGVAIADDVGVVVGDGGCLLERDEGNWERRASVATESLAGVCLAADSLLAVGETGTVLERRR
ncbi:hypothetical protein SAMN04487948_12812 [Halogranum amylolyticum]|uniref:PQQ-like domain-containing protein n=1 Tax=Halogranum amylolyticum TaxID=660520 RepID=A0A1H8WE24_9EURY|nr:hypothetical protein [Halogranum amylolyticum]SEP25881.1 hypothetical protein SAMN04487948_12812 [Halogranum amylolyticum]